MIIFNINVNRYNIYTFLKWVLFVVISEILAHRVFKGLKRKDTLPEFYTQFTQSFRGANSVISN